MKDKHLVILAWKLTAIVIILSVVAWGQGLNWQFEGLSTYALFPLFGLLAFSLMWTHYIVAAMRQYFGIDRAVVHQYFEVTSLAVLAAILIHPGLLAWQLWRDGLGLPPGSELTYRGEEGRIFILIAMVAWLVFLAYEFRRKYKTRSWWKYVQYSSDVGMILIFIHSLKLGGNLQTGWFKTVWWFYGLSLFAALAYIYYKKLAKRQA